MQGNLTRAQHYRALAEKMQEAAGQESDQKHREELLDLANQYGNLADRLIGDSPLRSRTRYAPF